MKKIIMSLCLLVSCSSFASNHLTANQLVKYKAKYAQAKEDISSVKRSISNLRTQILIQTLRNLEIEPLRNNLNAFNTILERGYEPYPNWITGAINTLKYGVGSIQWHEFYQSEKEKAYSKVNQNYMALLHYINSKSDDYISSQGSFNFSVNGEAVLDY